MSSSDCKSAGDSEYECSEDLRSTLFVQQELNDLVRDLDLPKLSALRLGSRLKSKKLLNGGVRFSWYKHREKKVSTVFRQ